MGKAKATAAPKTVDQLVLHALKLAATNPKAKWIGKSAKALFDQNEEHCVAAIDRCLDENRPLLKQTKDGGVLTPAGFEKVASELPAEEARTVYDQLRDSLPDDQVGVVAQAMVRCLPAGERVAFIQGVIRRTPLAATDLTPLLEEAVAAEKVEQEARISAAAKRRAADEAAKQALDRAKELIEELRRNRLDSLKREYEAEGGDPTDLQTPEPKKPAPENPSPTPTNPGPKLSNVEEKNFRRDVVKQLAEMWRAAWNEKKEEGREYLESAMWNVSGLKMIGELNAKLPFDGRYHECSDAVFTGDRVQITRPGWLVEEGSTDYVAIKAIVEKL